MERFAVVAHKGGTGKTTVSLNLAAELTGTGANVLLIDCDPQGALAPSLGLTTATKPTLYEVLIGETIVTDAIKPTSFPGLSLISSDLDLAGLEIEMGQKSGWQFALRDVLDQLTTFDYMVLDTAPGLGVLPYLALVASTGAIMVTPPEFLAFRVLRQGMETVERAQQQSAGLRLLGIVPTFASHQTRHAREALEVLRDAYGDKVLTEIPRRIAIQDATLGGLPIRDYAPKSDASKAFAQLASEVISRAEATKSA
jgi:chromosome partitioning protein